MGVKSLSEINEKAVDLQANVYADKYADQISVYESMSVKAVIKESISPYEIVALGQQLEQFENYMKFVEDQGNLGSLGAIPHVALDVITAAVGSSVLPLLASIQPIPDEHGIVYYKALRTASTNPAGDGGYQPDQIIASPLQRDNPGNGTLGSNRLQVTLSTAPTGNTATEFSGNVAPVPLRPYRFLVNVSGIGQGADNGNGQVLGFGFSGTIDYQTGAWVLNFPTAPAAGTTIQAIYDVDVDSQNAIDRVQGQLLTKDIKAQIWALAADVGAFANFAFSQRFGRSAVDEVATDLQTELTRILNTNAILSIFGNVPAGSQVTWSRTPTASGVSYAEHKLTFIDAIAAGEALIHEQSGAPVANRYICGLTAAQILRGMPAFEVAPNAANVSVGLYGYYNGVPVIRATGVLADTTMLMLSNSGNYFNAPLAYAPFMPLMITNTIQSPTNPFRQTTAAGVWAGMTALNGNLSTAVIFE